MGVDDTCCAKRFARSQIRVIEKRHRGINAFAECGGDCFADLMGHHCLEEELMTTKLVKKTVRGQPW